MLQLWFIANTILWPLDIQANGLHLRLNIIALALIGAAWIWNRQRITRFSATVFICFALFLIFSFLVGLTGICTDQLKKLIVTAPILLFLALIGMEIGWNADNSDWLKLQKTSVWVLLIAFICFFLEALVPAYFPSQAAYRLEGKFSGLFDEPSHVAISLFPCIAILLLAERKGLKAIGALALIGLLVLSRSSTLIVLIFAWCGYRLLAQPNLVRNLFFGLAVFLIFGWIALQYYDSLLAPTLLRIDGVLTVGEQTNMSSLVYVQGWQDAWANLVRTHGLGLGFNMMGCTPLPDVFSREILAGRLIEINSQDGSILISKIVSETGLIGVLFFVGVIWWWFRIELFCKKHCAPHEMPAISIQMILMFSFVITSLIRSPGYFNGGFLLLIIAVSATVKWRRSHRERKNT